MPGVLVKFNVDRTVTPVKNAYYNVPAAYREGAKRRLLDMEEDINEGTAHDETLQKVMRAIESGKWPIDLPKYKSVVADLSIRNGIVIKTGCAVVPENLQNKALQVAHEGHPTTSKMKSIIRQRVWWPNISKDVQNWVQSCKTCTLNGKPERTTPMERIFVPNAVWEMIAIDFNGPYVKFGGISILVIVDYRSRYLIARPVKSTSFECTKRILEEIFEREGYPKFIKSDNGPPFNGEDYKQYCNQRGISMIFSTPLFPQQNGMVESYMKVVNKAMATASTNKTYFVDELREAVNAHNAASHSVTGVPPEEVMLGRKIKRGLPLLQHEKASFDETLFEKSDRQSKLLGKIREDTRRGAKTCKVKPGDTVVVERHSRSKGDSRFHPKRYSVTHEKNGSLVLVDEAGQELKRHVSQTKRVHVWRDDTEPKKLSDNTSTSKNVQPIQPQRTATKSADITQPVGPTVAANRDARERRAPAHLKDYVRLILDDAHRTKQ